ncbi:MAG: beta-lactamase family protein [Sediminibacterium sp. Gen4]|jgi:CubicO group peptidase (beta-lactamase class C family)|uniref:serine hydrolase domain-containing protein n=1 Tax=unclassified Sediminibacterium TaxID=2635961 RepID=UPI0015BF9947|nr:MULTISPECIES: serine hydrolase domain-containing protein [unclassified Sediminibacterium]MBW0164236.1 beta-lactamase family protein [Sediminibacterium sp.]NWK65472.1 beta-lactamase family protein [Sediminibacterium sp. Gen4]
MRLLFTILFASVFTLTYGQIPDSLSGKIDAIFAEYQKPNSPGCALAILKDGKIIYQRGYGISNLEYNIPISPTSIFHIASISKQFTAAAIIRLSLEGKLSLNDDIRKYIPEVPDFGHSITFNNIIHHTSGIRDQWVLQWLAGWRRDDVITEKDILDMLSRQRTLNFSPGDEYSYCNTGFTLAALAVKRITGVSLRQYTDSVFFKPLKMANTHFHSDHSEITPNRTSAYRKDEQGIFKISIPVFDNYGATSLFTTVDDLAKWDENFYTKKIGGEDFIFLMQKTGFLNDKTPENYAAGLIISNYKGYKTVEHSGADAGYRSNFIRFPEEHFSVVLLANLSSINPNLLSYKVADLFLKDKSIPLPTFKQDNNVVQSWVGDYFDMKTQSLVKINFKNDKLNMGSIELVTTGNNTFKTPNSLSTLTFTNDEQNTQMEVFTQGEGHTTYKKVNKIASSTVNLEEYKGDFYSSELDTKYIVSIKDNSLVIKIPRNDEVKLSPFLEDIFTGNFIIRFQRNKKNKIEGFYLSAGRVRNLYYSKIATQ